MPSSEHTQAEAASRYSFLDDQGAGAHPALLKALMAANTTQEASYGKDRYCESARQRIRRYLGREDLGIFFVPTGTSANAISIAACLRPYEAVIAATSGHIIARETGAIELSGHKIINCPPEDGKLTPKTIQKALDDHWHFPHMAKPRMVYVSNATEVGTVYTKEEFVALRKICTDNNLLLFMDGARIGTAVMSKACGMTIHDILELTDMFWIGGTKNGALMGEAVVVKDPAVAADYEFYVKQHGSLVANGRVFGSQFAELFKENLYFDLALQANLYAEELSAGIQKAGFSLLATTQTNSVFVILPWDLIKVLQAQFVFYIWENRGETAVVRFLTTWATDASQMDRLLRLMGSA